MRILVLNAGSSSLKFRLADVTLTSRETTSIRPRLSGLISRIGEQAEGEITEGDRRRSCGQRTIADHAEAVRWMFELLGGERSNIEAVGHRVVHGGTFQAPVRIDPAVLSQLDRLVELAPLHNPASLAAIRATRSTLGPDVPMVAVFDTAFHGTLPPVAATYGIPQDLAKRHDIRRYGFHGIAHASLAEGYATHTQTSLTGRRLITLQLGNGCSITAIRDGHSVDTSMGFTPLEGLVMGTRSGDIDPSVVSYLMKREGIGAEEVEHWLNERSGLLGLSGLTRDMRLLLEEEAKGHAGARLAIELFCYRAKKYIGAYLAALGGADAIIFGGGIGERSPVIRARISEGMDWCGLVLDDRRNDAAVGLEPGSGALIGSEGARLPAYVVAVDEETFIARETARLCLKPA